MWPSCHVCYDVLLLCLVTFAISLPVDCLKPAWSLWQGNVSIHFRVHLKDFLLRFICILLSGITWASLAGQIPNSVLHVDWLWKPSEEVACFESCKESESWGYFHICSAFVLHSAIKPLLKSHCITWHWHATLTHNRRVTYYVIIVGVFHIWSPNSSIQQHFIIGLYSLYLMLLVVLRLFWKSETLKLDGIECSHKCTVSAISCWPCACGRHYCVYMGRVMSKPCDV